MAGKTGTTGLGKGRISKASWGPVIGPVSVGPHGRDPSLALPRIQHFLVDEDSYRDPTWQYRLEEVAKYVEEAEAARLRGDLGYDNPHVRALLEDVRILIQVHQGFDKWKNAQTRWTTDIIPTPNTSKRLPPLPDEPIPRPPNKKRNRRKWVDLGSDKVARSTVFSQLNSEKEYAEVYQYRTDEELYFKRIRDPAVDTVSSGFNRFIAENERFESCIQGGIDHTWSTLPPIPAKNASDEAFYEHRGWQRAALQQCLNKFTNHENRVNNTPWRRVILPFKEPVPMPKEVVYHARALDPERVTQELKEPFPWVYWHSQFAQLQNLMAQWERRRYNLKHWSDFQRSALPNNYLGPRIYYGQSVYDDYWLKIGAYLRRLHAYIFDAVGRAPRPLMVAILKDIEAGIHWNANTLPSPEDERRDIMRRGDIDELGQSGDAVLIDEADATWLRFLCEPSSTLEIWSPQHQPITNLFILFQTRLEEFFNDLTAFPIPEAPKGDVCSEEFFDWLRKCEEDNFAPIEDVLAYINVGTDGGESHGNELYQFTMEEAHRYIVRLGELGRCIFIVEDDETAGINAKVTHVTRPPYKLHPEHRVRWRYADRAAYVSGQRMYREEIIEHLVDAHELGGKNKDSPISDFEGVLEHRRGINSRLLARRLKKARQHPDEADRLTQALLRLLIQPEHDYVQGEYADTSIEKERQMPSWSDMMEWPAVAQAAAPIIAEEKIFEVPERTNQFFRNLAYRMGRTIAHVQTIESRLRHLVYAFPKTQQESVETALWKPISQKAFLDSIDHWWNTIEAGAGQIELKPPNVQDVIDKADPNGVVAYEIKNRRTGQFNPPISGMEIVREGIIKDCVMNRNTLYPGRVMDFEDSSGYYKNSEQFKSNKLFAGHTRPSLFKWATDGQRRYQAPYTRGAFFSMQRWPLFHQTPDRQDFIRRRQDEIPRLDPSLSSQRYGILQPRLVSGAPSETKVVNYVYGTTDAYGTKGTSGTKGASGTYGTRDPTSTKLPGTLGARGTSTLPNINSNTSINMSFPPTFDLSEKGSGSGGLPPSTFDLGGTGGALGGGSGGVPPTSTTGTTPGGGGGVPPTGTTGGTTGGGEQPGKKGGKKTRQLVPFERQKETFFPGPAIFPMAETLLQQVTLSQTLSHLIYPQPEPKWYEKVVNLYNTCVKWPESKVSLLPPITESEIPRSNPGKRKIPASFILSTGHRPDRPVKKPRRTTQPVDPLDYGPEVSQVLLHDKKTPWRGYPDGQPNLRGALLAVAASLAEQHPEVPYPNAEQLGAAATTDLEHDDTWANQMWYANEALQSLTGPVRPGEKKKPFPRRAYKIGLCIINKQNQPEHYTIPPNPRKGEDFFPPDDNRRHMLWVFVHETEKVTRYAGIITNINKIAALQGPPTTPGVTKAST